jgi:hypothetical protein
MLLRGNAGDPSGSALGVVAFFRLVGVFYLMVAKPR